MTSYLVFKSTSVNQVIICPFQVVLEYKKEGIYLIKSNTQMKNPTYQEKTYFVLGFHEPCRQPTAQKQVVVIHSLECKGANQGFLLSSNCLVVHNYHPCHLEQDKCLSMW
jgi:hypothetical protein